MKAPLLLLLALVCLSSCGIPTPRAASDADEAWDHRNRPTIFGLRSMRYEELAHPRALRGSLDFRPWRDSYWPFYKRNVAYRYQTPRRSESFFSPEDQVSDALGNPANAALSPAEKYDLISGTDSFELTRETWATYHHYQGRFPGNPGAWSWMGICSGWSPAAISEPAPKSHVLAVTAAGRQVLFYTGDLRGLLAKAYDLNAMSERTRMIGGRCDSLEGNVPRDAFGRPVDGKFSVTGESFFFETDHTHDKGVVEVRLETPGSMPVWLVASKSIGKLHGPVYVWRYASRDDVQADLVANTRGRRALYPRQEEVWFFKACRDANPASLHLTLAQLISDGASQRQSLIAEVNRGHEVWNHPVVAFKATMDMPRPLSQDDPARRRFRAPGTTHVADVKTYLVYVPGWAEPRAESMHDNAAPINLDNISSVSQRFSVAELRYSLEFDANGFLIGGEWRESPNDSGTMLDFFWQPRGRPTDDLKRGGPSPVKYSLVKRLTDCSQRDPDTTVMVMTPTGSQRKTPAVICDI
jgi:hypothetical protein